MKNEKNISLKQEKFCREYIIDWNGTQAAIRAGYSKKTANEQASRLLANVNIESRVNELLADVAKRNDITADMVMQELAKIGFSNIQDYIDSENAITDISKIDRDKAASVESITLTETEFGNEKNPGTKTKVSIKLHDKISALDKIARHFGMYAPEKVEHSGIVGIEQTPFTIKKRART